MGFVNSIKDFMTGDAGYEEDYNDYMEDGYADEAYEDGQRGSFRARFGKGPGRDYDGRAHESLLERDITIIRVRKYDDVDSVAEILKTNRPVIFDIIDMDKPDEGKRVVDFMVGAAFGLDGNIKRVSGGIFIATPRGMSINTDEYNKKKSSTGGGFGFDL